MAPSVSSASTAGPEILVTRPIFSGINSSSQSFRSQLSASGLGNSHLAVGPRWPWLPKAKYWTAKCQGLIAKILLLGCCSAHNLNYLFGDLCLAHSVHGQCQRVDHVAGIVCRRVHRSHPSSMFRSYRFLQTAINLNSNIFWQKRSKQLLWRLLVDVIDRCCGKFSGCCIDLVRICRTNTNSGLFGRFQGAIPFFFCHRFRLPHFGRTYLL